jgi:hypothetical protein
MIGALASTIFLFVLNQLVFDLKVSLQIAFNALKHLALDEPEEDLLADATSEAGNNVTHVRFSWKMRRKSSFPTAGTACILAHATPYFGSQSDLREHRSFTPHSEDALCLT